MPSKNPNTPKIAIIGRPNVGKSTLYNRFLGKRKSIVQRESGTTRDRLYGKIRWGGKTLIFIDTGGLRLAKKDYLGSIIDKAVLKAIKEADSVLLLVDGNDGLVPQDEEIAAQLRKEKKEVLVAVNKMDSMDEHIPGEFYELGFRVFGPISALHGLNTGDLLDSLSESFPILDLQEKQVKFRLAIVGEQNAGKSTFLNGLLKDERAIVSELPGTTRDYIEELLEWHGNTMKLLDTAGMRRRAKLRESSDFFSLSRTRQAVEDCDIALLIFDASKGFQKDSKVTARLVEDLRKGCVLVANKWDLIKGMRQEDYEKDLRRHVKFLARYPLCFISALNCRNIEKPLEYAMQIRESYDIRISTRDLNDSIKKIKKAQAWPSAIKLKYIMQQSTAPPTFSLFVKGKRLITLSNKAFLENQLARHFNIKGVRIHLIIKEEKKL